MNRIRSTAFAGCAAAILCLANPALAADILDRFATDSTLSDLELAGASGRNAPSQSASATTTGTVAGNSAELTYSGGNSISGDAFVGAVGVFTVIQNSGNNVLIQDSTVINVSLTQ